MNAALFPKTLLINSRLFWDEHELQLWPLYYLIITYSAKFDNNLVSSDIFAKNTQICISLIFYMNIVDIYLVGIYLVILGTK